MSIQNKKSYGVAMALMLFGLLAIYVGLKSLVVLIPAALLMWYEAKPVPRGGRN